MFTYHLLPTSVIDLLPVCKNDPSGQQICSLSGTRAIQRRILLLYLSSRPPLNVMIDHTKPTKWQANQINWLTIQNNFVVSYLKLAWLCRRHGQGNMRRDCELVFSWYYGFSKDYISSPLQYNEQFPSTRNITCISLTFITPIYIALYPRFGLDIIKLCASRCTWQELNTL